MIIYRKADIVSFFSKHLFRRGCDLLFSCRNMMVFRLHGDELVFGGTVHPVQPQIPQMKMMKVHIPFTFKLQDSCRSSHSGESCDLLALVLVHPSHLISCFQPNALVYYIFSYSSTCFEPYYAHHQEDLLYIHSIWFFMCHSSCVTVRCTGS